MKRLNAIIDTNVFVAALLGSRVATSVYDAFKKSLFVLSISSAQFSELKDVLSRPELKIEPDEEAELLSVIRLNAVITEVTLEVNDCRDPKDNIILASACQLKADCIVTCDRDILSLHPYQNIPVILPAKFLDLLSASS